MIREATAADLPRIVDLGERFLTEGSYAKFIVPDRASMTALAAQLIAVPHGVIFVSDRSGSVDGMIGVIATLHPYSGKPVMSELFWYVDPVSRGAGVRLLRAAEAWATANGIRHSVMVAPDRHVAEFYERVGYELLETQYIKELR